MWHSFPSSHEAPKTETTYQHKVTVHHSCYQMLSQLRSLKMTYWVHFQAQTRGFAWCRAQNIPKLSCSEPRCSPTVSGRKKTSNFASHDPPCKSAFFWTASLHKQVWQAASLWAAKMSHTDNIDTTSCWSENSFAVCLTLCTRGLTFWEIFHLPRSQIGKLMLLLSLFYN